MRALRRIDQHQISCIVISVFHWSAVSLLLLTGLLKLIAAADGNFSEPTREPVFDIPYQRFFILVGIAELSIASTMILLDRKHVTLRISLVAGFVTIAGFYRNSIAALAQDSSQCGCLGAAVTLFGMSGERANALAGGMLLYLGATCLLAAGGNWLLLRNAN